MQITHEAQFNNLKPFYLPGISLFPLVKQISQTGSSKYNTHDDVIKWKHFLRYWPFVRGIHWPPVNSPRKGQWRGALMFSLICALNKRLSKQSWGWWFDTPSRSLWRHCNGRMENPIWTLTFTETESLPLTLFHRHKWVLPLSNSPNVTCNTMHGDAQPPLQITKTREICPWTPPCIAADSLIGYFVVTLPIAVDKFTQDAYDCKESSNELLRTSFSCFASDNIPRVVCLKGKWLKHYPLELPEN